MIALQHFNFDLFDWWINSGISVMSTNFLFYYFINGIHIGYLKSSPSLVRMVARMVYTILIKNSPTWATPAIPIGHSNLPNFNWWKSKSKLMPLNSLKLAKPKSPWWKISGIIPRKNGTVIIPRTTEYSRRLIWKFMACFPFWSTKGWSFLFAVQSINGRRKFPNGIKYLEKVEACIRADKFFSCLLSVSVMALWLIYLIVIFFVDTHLC